MKEVTDQRVELNRKQSKKTKRKLFSTFWMLTLFSVNTSQTYPRTYSDCYWKRYIYLKFVNLQQTFEILFCRADNVINYSETGERLQKGN